MSGLMPVCPAAFRISLRLKGNNLRLSLLQHLESPACHSLTVDFYDVAYIDTSGLAVLVEVLKAARDRGKTLYLTRLRERPRYLLEATRLAHLFNEAQ